MHLAKGTGHGVFPDMRAGMLLGLGNSLGWMAHGLTRRLLYGAPLRVHTANRRAGQDQTLLAALVTLTGHALFQRPSPQPSRGFACTYTYY